MLESTNGGYFICGTPRTGSTLFCGLLRATTVAGNPESYFRDPDEPMWAARWQVPTGIDGRPLDYVDFVRAAVRERTTSNGVFGARVMWGTLGELVEKLLAAWRESSGNDLELLRRAFGQPRFIYIWRSDVVAQAVSWARAEQTGYWQRGDQARGAPKYSFDEIDRLVRTIEEHNHAWRKWFRDFEIQPFEMTFEELIADIGTIVRRVLVFLELQVPPDHNIVLTQDPQADPVNEEWISRYREATAK